MRERTEQDHTSKAAVFPAERPWIIREVTSYLEGARISKTVTAAQPAKQLTVEEPGVEKPAAGQPAMQYERPRNEFYSY